MKSLISHAIETGDEKAEAGADISKQLHLRQRKPRGAGDAEARGFISTSRGYSGGETLRMYSVSAPLTGAAIVRAHALSCPPGTAIGSVIPAAVSA